ncbi:hypothetical protein C1645_795194, partial [Glomus cerebriforme]
MLREIRIHAILSDLIRKVSCLTLFRNITMNHYVIDINVIEYYPLKKRIFFFFI